MDKYDVVSSLERIIVKLTRANNCLIYVFSSCYVESTLLASVAEIRDLFSTNVNPRRSALVRVGPICAGSQCPAHLHLLLVKDVFGRLCTERMRFLIKQAYIKKPKGLSSSVGSLCY